MLLLLWHRFALVQQHWESSATGVGQAMDGFIDVESTCCAHAVHATLNSEWPPWWIRINNANMQQCRLCQDLLCLYQMTIKTVCGLLLVLQGAMLLLIPVHCPALTAQQGSRNLQRSRGKAVASGDSPLSGACRLNQLHPQQD